MRSIPYGRPIANAKYYVLGDALEHRPTWVPGKLYCAGAGLAKGYWRDDEKTTNKFIYHTAFQERLYDTGDLGRYLPDGNIEFLGREDFQVKIRGYRVELGEIEYAIARHPDVRAVVVLTLGESEDNQLIAYFVPSRTPPPSRASLRSFLQQKLPEYMIPANFIALDELPVNSAGKLDRRALPLPAQDELERSRPTDQSNISTQIRQIVMSVINLRDLESDTDLLSLGATSLDIIRIANLLEKELGFRPKIDEFFGNPTVSGLTRLYHGAQTAVASKSLEASLAPEELMVDRYEVILDPEERRSFKDRQPGLRHLDGEQPHVQLIVRKSRVLREQYARRQSYRKFSSSRISFDEFSGFLGCLRQIRLNGAPKYLYPSGGGLYPVQTYLYVKVDRIQGVGAGTYYYDPTRHRLFVLTANGEIPEIIYSRLINRPVFESAAFGVFLIVQSAAIAPMYGSRSADFAKLEAGYMSQLMMMHSPAHHIGLCPIGTLEFEGVRDLFLFEESHVLVHSLLGGLIDSHAVPGSSPEEVRIDSKNDTSDWEEGEL
jgi:SagB-type dehydrogenase family enzyme